MAVPIMFPLFTCAASKALAVAYIKGISLKGFPVFDTSIVFLRARAGMKIAKPSKPTTLILFGTGIAATSLAVVQTESLPTVGTTMLQFARAEIRLIWTHVACASSPIIPTTLFLGRVLVPPKFLVNRKSLCSLFHQLLNELYQYLQSMTVAFQNPSRLS